MMEWLGRALGLPSSLLASSGTGAGGVIQGTASEASLVTLLSARRRTVYKVGKLRPDWTQSAITAQLVAYTSGEVHLSPRYTIATVKINTFLPSQTYENITVFILKTQINSLSAQFNIIHVYIQAKQIKKSVYYIKTGNMKQEESLLYLLASQ